MKPDDVPGPRQVAQVDHLSHEGFYAGKRYCGAADGTSCHPPYVRDLDAWAAQHVRCADCRRILAEAGDGDGAQ